MASIGPGLYGVVRFGRFHLIAVLCVFPLLCAYNYVTGFRYSILVKMLEAHMKMATECPDKEPVMVSGI